jgi:uncharacterized protein
MKYSGFDWDKGNKKKCQKHGLSLKKIENVFTTKKLFISPDIRHSQNEKRFLAISQENTSKRVFVAFTLRVKNNSILIRPISARYMHKKEQERYVQTTKNRKNTS